MFERLTIVLVGSVVLSALSIHKGFTTWKAIFFFIVFGVVAVLASAFYSHLLGRHFLEVVLLRDAFGSGKAAVGGYVFIGGGTLLLLFKILFRRR